MTSILKVLIVLDNVDDGMEIEVNSMTFHGMLSLENIIKRNYDKM